MSWSIIKDRPDYVSNTFVSYRLSLSPRPNFFTPDPRRKTFYFFFNIYPSTLELIFGYAVKVRLEDIFESHDTIWRTVLERELHLHSQGR